MPRTTLQLSLALLMLPFAIFACFWLEIWVTIPVLAICLWALHSCRCPDLTPLRWSTSAILQAGIAVIIILLIQYLVGYNGEFPQHWDFRARNAQFGSLCRESWPIYSKEGYPLVYYFASWYPAAALSKLIGFEWRNELQFAINTIYLIVAYLVICYRVGRISLSPLVALLVITGWPHFSYMLLIKYSHVGFEPQSLRFYHAPFFHQMLASVNISAITFLASALLLLPYQRRSSYLFVAAIAVFNSPLSFFSLLPITLYQILKQQTRRGLLNLLRDPLCYLCPLLVLIAIIYYTQISTDGNGFGWGPSQISPYLTPLFWLQMASVVGFFSVLMYQAARHQPLYWVGLAAIILAMLLSYGENFNEILFKTSIPFYAILAVIYHKIWKKGASRIPQALSLLCLLLFCYYAHQEVNQMIKHYQKPNNVKDPFHSDYYSPEAYAVRQATGYRIFNMPDQKPRPLIPHTLRRGPE